MTSPLNRLRAVTAISVFLLGVSPCFVNAQGVTGWDFEDGTLQGWTNILTSGADPTMYEPKTETGGGSWRGLGSASKGSGTFAAVTPFAARDAVHSNALLLRSPEFSLANSGQITAHLLGGNPKSSAVAPDNFSDVAAISGAEVNNSSGYLGISLRRASDGEYLAHKTRNSSDSSSNWQQMTFTEAELGVIAAANPGAMFTLDLMDWAGGGSWSSVALDTITIPVDTASSVVSGGGQWSVLQRNSASGGFASLTDAIGLLSAPSGAGDVSFEQSSQAAVIDYHDTGNSGHFGNDNAFGGGGGDNFAVKATGRINVTQAGDITFGFYSGDGGRLMIDGVLVAQDDVRDIASDTLGTVNLSAGSHKVEFVYFEDSGSATTELYVSKTNGTFTSLNEAEFELLEVAPGPVLRVNRDTGAMVLENPAGAPALDLQGYQIGSSTGALNTESANWKSIANNYDGDNDQSVDDDIWTILSAEQEGSMDMSEFQFGGTPGDGATIAPNQSIVLSQGDGAWIPSDIEDLIAQIMGSDGIIENLAVVFEGNGDESFLRSDLDTDGDIDGDDWVIFKTNDLSTDLSALPETLAYRMGDVDRDFDIDTLDFRIFKDDFEAENGAGSFAAMLQSVPEPSSLLLLGLAAPALGLFRSRKKVSHYALLVLAMVTVSIGSMTQEASAELVAHYTFEGANVGEQLEDKAVGIGGVVADDLTLGGGTPAFIDSDAGGGIKGPSNVLSLLSNNDKASAPDSVDLTMPGSFTITAWAKYNQAAPDQDNYGTFINKRLDSNQSGDSRSNYWIGMHDGSDVVRFSYDDEASATQDNVIVYLHDASNFDEQEWHHYAWVLDTAGEDSQVYIDGQLVHNETGVTELPAVTAGAEFLLGLRGQGTSDWDGWLDEVRLYDNALSASEVQDIVLGPDRIKALIHPDTGEMILTNDGADRVFFDSYELSSSDASLLPGDLNWNSLDDQNWDAIGSGEGESWDEGGQASTSLVGERYLLNDSFLDPGDSVSIGEVFDVSGEVSNLELVYSDSNFGVELIAEIELVLLGDMDGNGLLEDADVNPFVEALTDRASYESNNPGVFADFVGDFNGNGKLDLGDVAGFKAAISALPGSGQSSAVPEPSSLALLSLIGCVGLLSRRGRNS